MNMEQTGIFQTLSEQLRLRALILIALEGELCVCEIMHALDMPQPKVSRHMSLLREAGILVARRHAQWVFYGLNPSLPPWQQQIIEAAVTGIREDAIVRQDRQRLSEMKNRPQRCQTA